MSWSRLRICLALCLLVGGLSVGCDGNGSEEPAPAPNAVIEDANHADERSNEGGILTLPKLEPAALDGGKLQVVATTSIIGDVVAHVGGEAIELTTLMEPGQDPHSYEPGARELTVVADAHLIFVNGWDLEEGLIDALQNVAGNTPFVPVSARIKPRELTSIQEQDDDHTVGGSDPHTWLDPHNVVQWTANVELTLSSLDPDHTAVYQTNAAAYQAELEELLHYFDEQVAGIGEDGRKLVTNHGAFGYFADRYNFQVVGTILPAFSALAEPSANELAALVQTMRNENICVIFAETTANDQLAQAVAAELNACTAVQILSLHTGTLGVSGSGADSYIGMMQTNMDTIVKGLEVQ